MGDESLERFLREVRPALHAIASRYRQADHEDLVAVGIEAAWKAFERGVTSPRLAIGKARWAMIDYLRTLKPGSRRGEAWVAVSISELYDKGVELRAQTSSVEELTDRRWRSRALLAALRKLPRRQRLVVRASLRGIKQVVIARRLRVTEARVSQILTAASVALARHIAGLRSPSG